MGQRPGHISHFLLSNPDSLVDGVFLKASADEGRRGLCSGAILKLHGVLPAIRHNNREQYKYITSRLKERKRP